jgi:hypothetical protein
VVGLSVEPPLVYLVSRAHGSGIAEGKAAGRVWSEQNVKWKVAVQSGLSSPIVAGDLLVLTAFNEGQLFTCLPSQRWREAWRRALPRLAVLEAGRESFLTASHRRPADRLLLDRAARSATTWPERIVKFRMPTAATFEESVSERRRSSLATR